MTKDFEDWASSIGRISQSIVKSLQPMIQRSEQPAKLSSFTTIIQKTVLDSPLQQAIQQTQKSLNPLRDAGVSIKPALESMRLATEVSTSMFHRFPAMPDLYLPDPIKIPIAIGALQSTQLASVAKLSQSIISPSFCEFADLVRTGRLYKSLPQELQELIDLPEFLRELAKSGWYLSDRLCDKMLRDFPGIVKNGDLEEIGRTIIECLQEQFDSIKDEIIDSYPKRRTALSEAFDAHERKMYTCSIKSFFPEADGIFRDKSGGEIFMSDNRKKVAKNYNIYKRLLLKNDSAPLWIPKGKRSKDFQGLNRHQIMHGESVGYGNELNSLKAISFLYWIHCL